MNIIKQNPFRILGVTADVTEKELQKQISIIKRYAEIGKTKSFAYDFDFLGKFSRNFDDIQQASSRIEQAQKRLQYALFWFVNNSQVDEIALTNLRGQNTNKAIEIWEKTLMHEVTDKNYSSYLNLSTLYIALSVNNGSIERQSLQRGVELKGRLILSDSINIFSELITGNELSVNSDDLIKMFIDEIIDFFNSYSNNNTSLSITDIISLFFTFPGKYKKYILSKFTQSPISNIENKIDKTARKRKNNPRDAGEYGEELYKSTKSDISLLKELLSSSNVQYQMIANKLSNEILQCSIDFFNKHRDENTEFDPGDDAYKIAKYAKSIGATGQTRNRINEALTSIQEWLNDKPNRVKISKIKAILNQIDKDIEIISKTNTHSHNSSQIRSLDRVIIHSNLNKLLDNYPGGRFMFIIKESKSSVNRINNAIMRIEPNYDKLVSKLSNSDPIVKDRGKIIVLISQNILIKAFNSSMDAFNKTSMNDYDNSFNDSEKNLRSLYSLTKDIYNSLKKLEHYYMDQQTKAQYNKNITIIKKQENDMYVALQNRIKKNQPTNGCYIATMAYGDYDHPQVMILRRYRDETLSNSFWGRIFIRLYYTTSPSLVKLIGDQKHINKLVRGILDNFIKKISRKNS